MKVMFINSIAKKKFGGGEKWMVTAAKGLSEAGHEIIVSGKKNSRFLDAAKEAGLHTKHFNIRGDFGPVNTFRIARYLKKQRVDVLICNLNKDVRVAGLAAKFMHETVVLARHGVLLSGKKWKHKITLTKILDGILTNARNIKHTYQGYGWFRDGFVQVIYNGIEDKSHVVAFDFEESFPGKKIVFSAGRLVEQKGFAYLIQAAAELRKKRDDLVFIVAGEGRLEQHLKRLVRKLNLEDSVHFWGYVKDVDPYVKGCDLFVLPSLFEGMPNAVMEAMALGKAVIATDVNGVTELMEDNKTGLIIPPKDSKILAEAIHSVIDDEARLEEFGKNGLEKVQKHFTISAMIKRLEDYLQQKIDEKKRHQNN